MSGNVCLCEAGGGWCHSPLLVSPSNQVDSSSTGLWRMWWRGWTDWSGSKQLPGEKKCPCAAGTWLDTTYHLIISWKEGQHIFGVVEKLAEPFHRREDICMKLQADGFLRRVKPMSRLFNVVQKPPDTLFTQSQKCLRDLWADAIITEGSVG